MMSNEIYILEEQRPMTFLNGAEGRSVSELPETLFGPTIQLEMPLFFHLMLN